MRKSNAKESLINMMKKFELQECAGDLIFTSKESHDYRVGFNPMELESQIYSLQHEKVESMDRL